jgi:hypothetical protein
LLPNSNDRENYSQFFEDKNENNFALKSSFRIQLDVAKPFLPQDKKAKVLEILSGIALSLLEKVHTCP